MLGFSFNIYGVVLLFLAAVFVLALWSAHKTHKLDWTDMLTRDGSKVSTTKILQLVGGVVGTWIIIQVTLQEKITWDLFAIYLAYVASIDGFSKLVMAKYGAEGSDDSRVPYRRRSRDRLDPLEDETDDLTVDDRRQRLREKLNRERA
jgi:hypothetical protein